jgi:hypothetical protein
VGGCGLNSSGSEQGPVASSCEHGNEPSASIKDGEFFDYLSKYKLFKKDRAPCRLVLCTLFLQCPRNRVELVAHSTPFVSSRYPRSAR